MVNIKLQSSDGYVFEIDADIAKCFGLIKDMLDTCGEDEDNDEPISIPFVNSVILKKVIQWVIHHKDDPPVPKFFPTTNRRRTDDISLWDAVFLYVDNETLAELVNAAHYLDVRGLLDAACKTIANIIAGKSYEQLLKFEEDSRFDKLNIFSFSIKD